MSLFHVIEKQSLRRAAMERRTSLGAPERAAAAAAVVEGGLRLAARYGAGGVVALFSSIRDEIDTGPLAAALAKAGHALALPAIVEPSAPLQFRRWTPGDELMRGPKGILEPPATAEPASPVLVFVPLAAFDRRGGRIGYGGGYYDRTLGEAVDADPAIRPVAVGLAFAVQEVFRVPDLPHDVRLDHILTERETIACRSAA